MLSTNSIIVGRKPMFALDRIQPNLSFIFFERLWKDNELSTLVHSTATHDTTVNV